MRWVLRALIGGLICAAATDLVSRQSMDVCEPPGTFRSNMVIGGTTGVALGLASGLVARR
jgi:hypothetical protein